MSAKDVYYEEKNIEVKGGDLVLKGDSSVVIKDDQESTSCTTGALIVNGGVGIAKNLNLCGDIIGGCSFTVQSGSGITTDFVGGCDLRLHAQDDVHIRTADDVLIQAGRSSTTTGGGIFLDTASDGKFDVDAGYLDMQFDHSASSQMIFGGQFTIKTTTMLDNINIITEGLEADININSSDDVDIDAASDVTIHAKGEVLINSGVLGSADLKLNSTDDIFLDATDTINIDAVGNGVLVDAHNGTFDVDASSIDLTLMGGDFTLNTDGGNVVIKDGTVNSLTDPKGLLHLIDSRTGSVFAAGANEGYLLNLTNTGNSTASSNTQPNGLGIILSNATRKSGCYNKGNGNFIMFQASASVGGVARKGRIFLAGGDEDDQSDGKGVSAFRGYTGETAQEDNDADAFIGTGSTVSVQYDSDAEIVGGVVYATGQRDFGEWLEVGSMEEWNYCLDEIYTEGENLLGLPEGFVVYVREGKFWKEGAGTPMVITRSAAFVGNESISAKEGFVGEIVSFAGQVPVFVKGSCKDGDYLVPQGNYCISISKEDITFQQYKEAVAICWESSDSPNIKRVKAAIGIK